MTETLWSPKKQDLENSLVFNFKTQIENKYQLQFKNYFEFWKWSVNSKKEFWLECWDFFSIKGKKNSDPIIENESDFIQSKWFPKSELNYAHNIIAKIDSTFSNSEIVIDFQSENKVTQSLTKFQLFELVLKIQNDFISHGLKAGDRVCGMVPNHPYTIAYMLATTSLGGVWTSCSPDFGVQGVLDRFSQVDPMFFISCDGYYYSGKTIDCLEKIKEITTQLTTLKKTYFIGVLDQQQNTFSAVTLSSSSSSEASLNPTRNLFSELKLTTVNFNHPLFVMYSSGTTGIPKCIVHGHGGTLIQHLKEHQFHCNITPKDSVFYYTTCGWMMWNWLVTSLASGAKLLLYDGNPLLENGITLFDFLNKNNVSHLGTSAKFIDSCAKINLNIKDQFPLKKLKMILSTGSPLSPEGFEFVYQHIKSDVQLVSISGGTDIISCFVLGSPWAPVIKGEISVPGLGMDVDIWDDHQKSIKQEKGELVCKSTFPSKPIGFWNDDNNEKFKKSYFEKFPNIWCHGDYVELTQNNGYIIYGRSDATLNPGGVRIGTAEIYRQVEQMDSVVESIVVGQNWNNDVRVILFVKLKANIELNEDLTNEIKKQIRSNTTPRHVPALIFKVSDIPRTKSGKIVELAIKQIIEGMEIKNKEALANPEALEEFYKIREKHLMS